MWIRYCLLILILASGPIVADELYKILACSCRPNQYKTDGTYLSTAGSRLGGCIITIPCEYTRTNESLHYNHGFEFEAKSQSRYLPGNNDDGGGGTPGGEVRGGTGGNVTSSGTGGGRGGNMSAVQAVVNTEAIVAVDVVTVSLMHCLKKKTCTIQLNLLVVQKRR